MFTVSLQKNIEAYMKFNLELDLLDNPVSMLWESFCPLQLPLQRISKQGNEASDSRRRQTKDVLLGRKMATDQDHSGPRGFIAGRNPQTILV